MFLQCLVMHPTIVQMKNSKCDCFESSYPRMSGDEFPSETSVSDHHRITACRTHSAHVPNPPRRLQRVRVVKAAVGMYNTHQHCEYIPARCFCAHLYYGRNSDRN